MRSGWLRRFVGRSAELDWYPRWLAHLEAGAPDDLTFTFTADLAGRSRRCESLLRLVEDGSTGVDPCWLPHLAAAYIFADVAPSLRERLEASGQQSSREVWKKVDDQARTRERVRSGEHDASEFGLIPNDEDHIEALTDDSTFGADFVLAAGLWTHRVLWAPHVKQLVDIDVLWRQQASLDAKGRRRLMVVNENDERIPLGLGTLSALDELYLSGSRVEKLPGDISTLVSLRRLTLEGMNLRRLPEWFTSLQELQSLVLSSSGLPGIPQSVFRLPQLRQLEFGGSTSATSEFLSPPAVGHLCDDLEVLNVSISTMKTIAPSVTRLKNLRELRLSSMNEERLTLPVEFGELSRLKHLELCPSIGGELLLPPTLMLLRDLRYAKLFRCAEQACDVLSQMPWLEELHLGFHSISKASADALKKALPNTRVLV